MPQRTPALTRRNLCKSAALSAAGALLAAAGACDRAPPIQTTSTPATPPIPKPVAPPPPTQPTRSLIIYCSADTDLAKPVFEEFTKRTSIRIDPVFDTEATKTTGLVSRLLQEKDRPRADLFWSSEPFGVIRLARAGILDDSTSQVAERDMQGKGAPGAWTGWPRLLRDQRWLADVGGEKNKSTGPRWYGFGSRARVVVYNTKIVSKEDAPTDYARFSLDRFKGRIGMARPQFGTTRGHMAMLVDAWNKGPFGDYLRDLKRNGLRLFDGNGAVTKAVANSEIHIGFTDSDDVFAAQREGWPVAMSFIKCPDPAAKRMTPDHPRFGEMQSTAKTGTLLIPNTIARIKSGPNPSLAPEFIDFILGKDMQKTLAQSESHNLPVDPDLAKEFGAWLPPQEDIAEIDFEDAADRMDDAMKASDGILGT